jgi:vacuolar-type H+-ATPase subunit D/Vma8
MALDIKPTRSELINLKRRIKQTKNGYNLLKMKRDGLFHEFRNLLLAEPISSNHYESVELVLSGLVHMLTKLLTPLVI